ncbi:hypothetical protein V7968_38155 [Nocardia vulneris]|uniref:hypothetical protein n=1 Tax=Nocardia vulneris TaxID=1141657 RepID=UPI0030D07036
MVTVRLGSAATASSARDEQVAALVADGSVVAEAGTLALTDAGRNIHAQAWIRIRVRRRAMTDGVSDEQFADTLWVLQKMAANMSGAAPERRVALD